MKKRVQIDGRCQVDREARQLLVPLAEMVREDLRSFVVNAGMNALTVLLERERTTVCGARYRHDADRRAIRWGHAPGELVMGGRKVLVQRPRARSGAGGELVLPSWRWFSREDPLAERAMVQLLKGVSTRGYDASLEEVPPEVEVRGTSKSAVSRRFVVATQRQVEEWMQQSLSAFDLVVLMIDGVRVANHVVLVALGIDSDGRKQALGLWEGATENAAACTALLSNLVDRGLKTDQPVLVVLDGAKALRRAVKDVWGDRALVQRCQVHKKRNVLDHLPASRQAQVSAALSEAYHCGDVTLAKKLLANLIRRLEPEHPGAAASIKEGFDETLSVMALGLPPALERVLSSTNAIENVMSRLRTVSGNVKRWRDGQMIMRWMVASAIETQKTFRRVCGHAAMPKLVAALRAHGTEPSPFVAIKEAA